MLNYLEKTRCSPGEWQVSEDGRSVETDTGAVLATRPAGSATAAADASLMAAAPSMMAALQWIIRSARMEGPLPGMTVYSISDRVMDAASASLTKASAHLVARPVSQTDLEATISSLCHALIGLIDQPGKEDKEAAINAANRKLKEALKLLSRC